MKCIIIAFIILNFVPNIAQSAERILSITSSAEVTISSTMLEAQIIVKSTPRSLAIDAQHIVNGVAQQIATYLTEQQVAEVIIGSSRLQQKVVDLGDRTKRKVYVAESSVIFRHETDQIGLLIDQAMGMGATSIQNIQYYTAQEDLLLAWKAAIKKAIILAMESGDAALETIGESARGIHSINVDPIGEQSIIRDAVSHLEVDDYLLNFPKVEATVHMRILY